MTDDPILDLLRRAEDLADRCERRGSVTHTSFLTPAEARALRQWAGRQDAVFLLFHGGVEQAERTVAFFLPDWMEPYAFSPEDTISALSCTAHFGEPGHRDYLGAILGLGISREWVGDILVEGQRATVLCISSVAAHILTNLESVGRTHVTVSSIPLSQVAPRPSTLRPLSFTVMSARLDAVCGGLFRLSRSRARDAIVAGAVRLNDAVCLKPDTLLQPGDVISFRGKGKGVVSDFGSLTRKGRVVVNCGIYV